MISRLEADDHAVVDGLLLLLVEAVERALGGQTHHALRPELVRPVDLRRDRSQVGLLAAVVDGKLMQ